METVKKRLESLREYMKSSQVEAMIITGADPHLSEYVAEHYQIRGYFSGFTGSAGSLVLTKKKAGLWTDFRYWTQAGQELEGSGIDLFKEGQQGTIPFLNWLCSELPAHAKVGVDGNTLSFEMAQKWAENISHRELSLVDLGKMAPSLWSDRPDPPLSEVYTLPPHITGLTHQQKIDQLRNLLSLHGCEATFLSSLDDIAWLLNIRGMDIPMNPVVRAYCWVDLHRTILFVDQSRFKRGVQDELEGSGVALRPYQDYENLLKEKNLPQVYISPQRNTWQVGKLLSQRKLVLGPDITTLLKSKKNPVEIDCIRKAMVEDGAAMVNFSHWLKTTIGKETITELDAAQKSRQFREAQRDFVDESFTPIPAYGAHGALPHYSAGLVDSTPLKPEGLFLFDSGGQYLGATTDITRTYSLGTPTEQEREDYTLVLKGHIALSQAIFPEGTRGYQLDALARTPLWAKGMDYGHGTGHGVGAFLNVHEGPHSISSRPLDKPLLEGSVTSNEPGLYREGTHGIRIENLILTVKADKSEFGQFFKFETLTLCPYEKDLINCKLLSTQEKKWIDHYHKRVFNSLSPLLTSQVESWLRIACSPL